MMIKKAFLASLVCSFALSANMVNGITAIVENEPITTFEVQKVKEQLKINDQKALDLLIRDRLEQAQIKALSITTTPFEINQRVEVVARQSGMSVSEFRSELEFRRGIKFSDFKSDIEKSILQEKLYKQIFAEASKNVSEASARAYFESNRGEFSTFESIDVVIFRSSDKNAIEKQVTSGAKAVAGVSSESLSLAYDNINPRLAILLANTQTGTFTQILQSSDSYDAFYVKAKHGLRTPEFEDVKERVMTMMHSAEQERVAAEYFEKLRAKAKIEMIR